jgi:hypothetical protein
MPSQVYGLPHLLRGEESHTSRKIRRAPYFFFLKNGKQMDKVVGIDADELETKVKLHSRKQASKLAS